jgi:hypothetical protein
MVTKLMHCELTMLRESERKHRQWAGGVTDCSLPGGFLTRPSPQRIPQDKIGGVCAPDKEISFVVPDHSPNGYCVNLSIFLSQPKL